MGRLLFDGFKALFGLMLPTRSGKKTAACFVGYQSGSGICPSFVPDVFFSSFPCCNDMQMHTVSIYAFMSIADGSVQNFCVWSI